MDRVKLEELARKEMIARNTRPYRQKIIRECVAGMISFTLVVTFLVLAMSVF